MVSSLFRRLSGMLIPSVRLCLHRSAQARSCADWRPDVTRRHRL